MVSSSSLKIVRRCQVVFSSTAHKGNKGKTRSKDDKTRERKWIEKSTAEAHPTLLCRLDELQSRRYQDRESEWMHAILTSTTSPSQKTLWCPAGGISRISTKLEIPLDVLAERGRSFLIVTGCESFYTAARTPNDGGDYHLGSLATLHLRYSFSRGRLLRRPFEHQVHCCIDKGQISKFVERLHFSFLTMRTLSTLLNSATWIKTKTSGPHALSIDNSLSQEKCAEVDRRNPPRHGSTRCLHK